MNYFWKKKTIISYFLCILVFWIHISSFNNYKFDDSVCSRVYWYIDVFLTKIITPVAVPLFFIISGVLFFRNYNSDCYIKKLKTRIKTLVVPYLSWNIIYTLFAIATSYSFISNYFIGREKFVITLKNVLLSVFLYRSGPLWFIFCLIVFALCAPALFIILENKIRGLCAILIIAIFDQIGIGLPIYFFYSQESIVYYLIGAYIGIHYMDWFVRIITQSEKKMGTVGLIITWGVCVI